MAKIENFELFLYDKPLDEIAKWYAGLEICFIPYRREGIPPSTMRRLTETDALGVRHYFTIRLIEYAGSEAVTVVSRAALKDTHMANDIVSGVAGALFMNFRTAEGPDCTPQTTDFIARRTGKLIRGVTAHTGESRATRNKWTMIEHGEPLECEGQNPYPDGRINGPALVRILENLGLDFDSYVKGKHNRVIEIGRVDNGEDLSQFQKEADILAPYVRRSMGRP